MLKVSGILIELLAEVLRWLRLAFRSSQSIQAENLFLRRQLALYIKRGAKPRRIDSATRIALTSAVATLRLARCAGCGAPGDVDSLAPSGMAFTLAVRSPDPAGRRFLLNYKL